MLSALRLSWIAIAILIIAGSARAQVTLATSGGLQSANRSLITYTVGQPVASTQTGMRAVLTVGFQQTDLTATALNDEALDLALEVYPNPTTSTVTVSLPAGSPSVLIRLMDAHGRAIHHQNIDSSGLGLIDLFELPVGVYFLVVTATDRGPIGTYKILKGR